MFKNYSKILFSFVGSLALEIFQNLIQNHSRVFFGGLALALQEVWRLKEFLNNF